MAVCCCSSVIVSPSSITSGPEGRDAVEASETPGADGADGADAADGADGADGAEGVDALAVVIALEMKPRVNACKPIAIWPNFLRVIFIMVFLNDSAEFISSWMLDASFSLEGCKYR